MNLESKKLFNNDVLERILKRYNYSRDDVTELGGFESFIYKVRQPNQDLILRISHSLHRTTDEIIAELEFVNFLAANGVSVAPAYPSSDGNLVEEFQVGDSYFLTTVFKMLEGQHLKPEDRSAEVYEQLGSMIGKMHRLTKSFSFSRKEINRQHWYEDFEPLMDFIPEDKEEVRREVVKVIEEIKRLPRDNDSYGLIHSDAHFGNMFINDGKLSLFDFDDAQYMYFISDLAIVVFYSVMGRYKDMDTDDFVAYIMTNLLKGYRRENKLSNYWIEKIPLFLKLREVELYTVIHMSFTEEEMATNSWCKMYMTDREQKILNKVPYLNYDFSKHNE